MQTLAIFHIKEDVPRIARVAMQSEEWDGALLSGSHVPPSHFNNSVCQIFVGYLL